MRTLKRLLTGTLLGLALLIPQASVAQGTSYLTPRAINLSYGTYTPTFTLTTNIASAALVSTAKGFWTRQGSIVEVSVEASITPSITATFSTLGISLPVASDLAVAGDLVGMGSANHSGGPFSGPVSGSPGFDRAVYNFTPSTASARTHYITFRYRILP